MSLHHQGTFGPPAGALDPFYDTLSLLRWV